MTPREILIQTKSAGLRLWLELRDGKLGIAYNDIGRVRPFIPHIKANRDELIRLLKLQLPKLPEKKIPGAIALELSRRWLNGNKSEDDVLVSVPTRSHWLVGWLSPAKQWEFQLNTKGGDDGRLAWRDWNAVCEAVEAQFHAESFKALKLSAEISNKRKWC